MALFLLKLGLKLTAIETKNLSVWGIKIIFTRGRWGGVRGHAPGALPTPLAPLVHVTDNRIMRYYSCVLCYLVCKTWSGHFSLNVILRIHVYWQHNNSVFSEQLLIVFRYIDLDYIKFSFDIHIKDVFDLFLIMSNLQYTFLYDPKNIPVRNIPTTCKWYHL